MTNKVDCFTGVGITLLSVLVYYGADQFPKSASGIGAGGFPKFIAFCLGILGVLLAIKSYMKLKKGEKDVHVLNLRELLYAGILVITFYSYIVLVKPLGYIISTSIFFFVFMFIFGEQKWFRMTIISITFSVAIYYLFEKVFYIILPRGNFF